MYLPATQETRTFLVVALILAFGPLPAAGQEGGRSNKTGKTDVLTIVNPRQVDIPNERARVLLLTTCRVVAEEFRRRPEDVELAMTLVLGDGDEHYSIDKGGRMTMYLERWDEAKFVNGVITSVIQRMAPLHRRNQMFTEILRRTDQIAPVSAKQLRNPAGSTPLPTREPYPTCISEMATTPCSALNRPAHRP
jgi:hypothetical protein